MNRVFYGFCAFAVAAGLVAGGAIAAIELAPTKTKTVTLQPPKPPRGYIQSLVRSVISDSAMSDGIEYQYQVGRTVVRTDDAWVRVSLHGQYNDHSIGTANGVFKLHRRWVVDEYCNVKLTRCAPINP